MSYITPGQLAHQRQITAGTFTDTCQRQVYTPGSGSYGYKGSYAPGASTPCLFAPRQKPDAMPGTDVRMVDAELYWPLGFEMGPDDRVMITHIYGEAVAQPQTYEIVAGPVTEHVVCKATVSLITE